MCYCVRMLLMVSGECVCVLCGLLVLLGLVLVQGVHG